MKNFLDRRLLFAGLLNLTFGTMITMAHWQNGTILLGLGMVMLIVYFILRMKSAHLFENHHNFKRNSKWYWLFAGLIFTGFTAHLFFNSQFPYMGTMLIMAGIAGEVGMVWREYKMVRNV